MAAITQHRPRAGSGEVNIQCIRVRPLRIAFHRSDFLLAHRLLKRSRDASGKPLELVVLRTQGKKDRPKAVSGDLAASAEACAHDTVGIPVKNAQAKTASVRGGPD